MDGKGYLLPSDPEPEGLTCLLIYVPSDPMYLAAMAGAFIEFGSWLQWEKDNTNRASLAAKTWKDAIDYTFENGWLQCEDMLDKIDDILDQLKELNNMNVNVCCGGCGCGCKGGGNGGGFVGDDGLPIETNLPPVPSNQEPESYNGAWTCDAAHQFVDQWIDFYANTFNLGIIGNASIGAVLSIAIAAGILTGGIGLLLILVAALALVPAATASDWIRDWLVENTDGLICAMVSAATPAGAYNNAIAYLAAHKSDQHGSFAGGWIERIIQPVFQDTDWNLLFTPDSFTIDIGNQGSTCNCLSATDLLGDGTWYLIPAVEGEEEVTVGSITVSNYIWHYVGGDNEIAESYPSFSGFLASGRTWIGDVAGSGEHAGYVLQRLSPSGDVTFEPFPADPMIGLDSSAYASGEVWTKWQVASDLIKATFQSELETIFDGFTVDHTADRTFDNLSQHRVRVAGAGAGSHNTQFRVYAVVAATALNI